MKKFKNPISAANGNQYFSWFFRMILVGVFSWFVAVVIVFLLGQIGTVSDINSKLVFYVSFGLVFTQISSFLILARFISNRDNSGRSNNFLLSEELKKEIDYAVSKGVGSAISPLLRQDKNFNTGTKLWQMMQQITEANSDLHPEILSAKIILLSESFNGLNRQFETLTTSGINVDVLGHLRVTRSLLEGASVYLQVQTNLELTPDTWTPEWRRFLDGFAENRIQKKYIMVGTSTTLEKYIKNITQVSEYLKTRGFYVGLCDISNFDYKTEKPLLENSVVEFFGGEVIKAVRPTKGKYSGARKVKMTITSQSDDTLRHKYLLYVDQHEFSTNK